MAEHQRCGDLDGGRDSGYVWLACSFGRESRTRLTRLPQNRHEPNAAVGERERDNLLPVPAPVDVGLDAVRLPANVLQVLDSKTPEPSGYLSAAPRAGVGGHRTALLIGPPGRDHDGRVTQ